MVQLVQMVIQLFSLSNDTFEYLTYLSFNSDLYRGAESSCESVNM